MINLDESFDNEYYEGIKGYLDKAWSKYNNISLKDKEKALKEIKETDGSFDEKDILAIIAFVVKMFSKGTLELTEKFNEEATENGLPESEFIYEEWVEQNIEMISEGIPEEIKKIYAKEMEENEVPEEAREEAYKKTDNKIDFWAVDQTGDLVNKTSEGLFLFIGNTQYIWRDQRDKLVRESHRVLNGTTRTWGVGISPGEEYRCRCYAELIKTKSAA